MVRRGADWFVKAGGDWRVPVCLGRLGSSRHVQARSGKVRQASSGWAGHGAVRFVKAGGEWPGKARSGLVS